MAQKMPWFRLYGEILFDRKIARICSVSGQPKATVIGLWTMIMAVASESPQRGLLLISQGMPITGEEIALEAGLPQEIGESLIKLFIGANMLRLEGDCFEVVHWQERQPISDTNGAERVARHRAKKKEQPQGDNGQSSPVVSDSYTKRYSNVTVTGQIKNKIENKNQEEVEQPKKRHNDFEKVCLAYQYEIGGISGVIADALNDDLERWGLEWVTEAMKRAAKANIRRLDYVEGILKKWEGIGGPQKDKPQSEIRGRAKGAGQGQADQSPLPTSPDLPPPVPLTPEQETWAKVLDRAKLKVTAETFTQIIAPVGVCSRSNGTFNLLAPSEQAKELISQPRVMDRLIKPILTQLDQTIKKVEVLVQ